MDPDQIFRQHETEKKRQYASRVLEVEQATFTPLVFSTTAGMAVECKRYHSTLAELVATKKGKNYQSINLYFLYSLLLKTKITTKKILKVIIIVLAAWNNHRG